MNNLPLVQKMNKRLMSAAILVVRKAEAEGLEIAINPKGTGESTAVFIGRKKGRPVTTVPEIKEIVSTIAEKHEWLSADGMKLKTGAKEQPTKPSKTTESKPKK